MACDGGFLSKESLLAQVGGSTKSVEYAVKKVFPAVTVVNG